MQAYLDGELEAARAAAVAAHLSACAACATVAREAADDFALFASALTVDDALGVPTERLRARIDAAVAALQPTRAASPALSTPFAERLRALASALAAGFASMPRQATAFASLFVAALLLASIFYVFRPQSSVPREQAGANETAAVAPQTHERGVVKQGDANASGAGGGENQEAPDERAKVEGRGVNNPAPMRAERAPRASVGFTNARYTMPSGTRLGASRPDEGATPDAAQLPIEKSYASAIASLKSSIESQKARSMTPTLRAEYERNLAVVDRAIGASRAAARRDPSDKDAQEFLRAAYQDKLELLRAVADQTQIASIGR